jgi:hypothetical protein
MRVVRGTLGTLDQQFLTVAPPSFWLGNIISSPRSTVWKAGLGHSRVCLQRLGSGHGVDTLLKRQGLGDHCRTLEKPRRAKHSLGRRTWAHW